MKKLVAENIFNIHVNESFQNIQKDNLSSDFLNTCKMSKVFKFVKNFDLKCPACPLVFLAI